MNTLEIKNVSALPAIASQLVKLLGDNKIVTFYGEMGAGKTTLIRALCSELGVTDVVSSPTYSLVNEYISSTGVKICHFDFYRIDSIDEVYDMGYEEYFESGAYCFIEWPERIADLLPKDAVKLQLSVNKNNVRQLTIS